MWMSLAPSRAACVEQGVEHADDGRVVGGFQQVFHRGQLLHHAREVGRAFDLADHGRRTALAARVGRRDALRQGVGRIVLDAVRRRTGAAPRRAPSARRSGWPTAWRARRPAPAGRLRPWQRRPGRGWRAPMVCVLPGSEGARPRTVVVTGLDSGTGASFGRVSPYRPASARSSLGCLGHRAAAAAKAYAQGGC